MKTKLLLPIFVIFFLAATVDAFVIEGYVRDTNATVLDNAHVEVFSTSNALINETNTDATGYYSFEAGNGLRIVNASISGFDTGSTPIFVDANKTLNFVLGPIDAVYISGYVRDTSNSPLANAVVRAVLGGAVFAETTTNSQGFYNLSVLPGEIYDVTASLVGYDDSKITLTMSISRNQDFFLVETEPSCVENWICTTWSNCTNRLQTRTCFDKNNCGIEATRPAESRSCGSSPGGGGSAGGGGAYSGITYTIELKKEGTKLLLRKNDVVKFYFKGIIHRATVMGVSTNSVNFVVQSTPVASTIMNGQAAKFDLNNDTTLDLRMSVESISYYKANVGFYLIEEATKVQQPAPAQTTTTSQTQTTTAPTQTTTITEPKSGKNVVVEDVVKGEEGKGFGIITTGFAAAVDFVKKIPYISYIATGIVILLIIIVALRLFKSEDTFVEEEKFSDYNREELRKKIEKIEKQISKLKKNL